MCLYIQYLISFSYELFVVWIIILILKMRKPKHREENSFAQTSYSAAKPLVFTLPPPGNGVPRLMGESMATLSVTEGSQGGWGLLSLTFQH